MPRTDVTFDSWGDRCAAWLYAPSEGARPAPLVVLCHGWSAIREAGLDPYAQRFAAAGIGALVFDYRGFGDSEGEPRQLLDVRRQHEDIAAALAYARTAVPWADPERVALWGSSFGGGHVLATAARDRRVAAVVAQVPFVDGLGNLPFLGAGHALRLTREGIVDAAGALAGRPPHMLSAVGPPGSLAVMTSPDAEPGFRALIPDGVRWRNETAARIALKVALYRPIVSVGRIAAPVLYCVANGDAVTPPSLALKAAARTTGAELRRYEGGHFDVYRGERFDEVIADQVEFLTRTLQPVGSEAEVVAA